MLSAIVGNPGEGKSITGSMMIRKYLDMGYRVYSNLHVNENRKSYFYFDTKDYKIIFDLKDGIIIFDEGQFLLDARKWQDLPEDFRYLLQKGRHEGLDFVCLTQNINQIDVAYRRLIHHMYKVKRFFTWKRFSFGIFLLWEIDLLKVEKEVKKGLPQIKIALKEDFQYYNSYALRSEQKDLSDHLILCPLCGKKHALSVEAHANDPQGALSVQDAPIRTGRPIRAIFNSLPSDRSIPLSIQTESIDLRSIPLSKSRY